MSIRKLITLPRLNNGLLLLIFIVDGYVILAPLLPAILFRIDSSHGVRQQQLTSLVMHNDTPTTATTPAAATTQPNHVIIPSMLLDQPVYDGPVSQQYKLLDKGIWRYSGGSSPDKGGNTVLVGHRFTYTLPKGVFYYLNKVQVGDPLAIWWNNVEYVYKVREIDTVSPADTVIEAPTTQPEVTIFTCTPLWLPTHRLVVIADLVSKS
jgi:sortase A